MAVKKKTKRKTNRIPKPKKGTISESVRKILMKNPEASPSEVMKQTGVSNPCFYQVRKKLREELESKDDDGSKLPKVEISVPSGDIELVLKKGGKPFIKFQIIDGETRMIF